MITNADARAALADYFGSKREWRESKAEKFPRDTRNARSANSLRNVADYLESLPDGDELLSRFARTKWMLDRCGENIDLTPAPDVLKGESYSEIDDEASRYGFAGDIEPATFLSGWLMLLEGEVLEN